MTNTYSVPLTQLESLFLSDSISMFMQGPPDAAPGQVSPYPTLLLKVGGAVLESEQHDSPVSVCLNLAELWMIREVAKSSVVVGSERVGLSLLLKIYEAISALTASPDMESVLYVFGEVAEDEPNKSDYAAQLERLKDGGDISSGGIENDAQDRNSGVDDKSVKPNEDGSDDESAAAS